jgi:hypothetical protein
MAGLASSTKECLGDNSPNGCNKLQQVVNQFRLCSQKDNRAPSLGAAHFFKAKKSTKEKFNQFLLAAENLH